MSFLLVSLLIIFLNDFEHCNDPGARGLIFQLFGKECEIRNLNSIEDRNTKLLQFNGMYGKMTKFRILSEEDLDMIDLVISVPKWPV